MAFLRKLTSALPANVRLAAAPVRNFYARAGLIGTARLPARLEKDHLPFYFRDSPDDRAEHVEEFSPEEAAERQKWIDKIIAMADSNQEPDLAVYEGVLDTLVKWKDANGTKTILMTLEELGLMDEADPRIVEKAHELSREHHIKSFWLPDN